MFLIVRKCEEVCPRICHSWKWSRSVVRILFIWTTPYLPLWNIATPVCIFYRWGGLKRSGVWRYKWKSIKAQGSCPFLVKVKKWFPEQDNDNLFWLFHNIILCFFFSKILIIGNLLQRFNSDLCVWLQKYHVLSFSVYGTNNFSELL